VSRLAFTEKRILLTRTQSYTCNAYTCVCVRACARGSSCRPVRRVLGIGQKRILPTKPKISRLITRRLIECRSFRALSARCLFSRPLPLSYPSPRHTDGFSLVLRRPFRLSHNLPPESSPSPPPATFSVEPDCSCANVLLRRRPSSATVLNPPSPPPPPPPCPPPRLIHIHAVVIVCRLPAGGHYYTSCARSRHREAASPATLLSFLPSSLCPPLCPPPPSCLPLLQRSLPRVSVNANLRFTTVSSNNLQTYHAVSAGRVLYLLAARGSLQIISRADFSSKRSARKHKASIEGGTISG